MMDDNNAQSTDETPSGRRAAGAAVVTAALVAIGVLTATYLFVVGDSDDEPFDDIDDTLFTEVEFEPLDDPEPPTKVPPADAERAPQESQRLDAERFDGFRKAFEEHYEEHRPQLIHVTMDRPMYRPEQPIRWRSWHVAPGDFSSDSDERDIDVELLDPQGSVVKEATVTTGGNIADGSFELDDGAPGGNWTLRLEDGDREYERPVLISEFEPPRFRQQLDFERDAYRSGEEVTAELEIMRDTGQPPVGLDVNAHLQVDGSHVAETTERLDRQGQADLSFRLPERIRDDNAAIVVTIEEGGLVETEVFPVPLSLEEVSVEFYPEGGRLVYGLESRVYFEATDNDGEPVEIYGWLIDNRAERVAKLETDHRGRGRISMTPERGRTYRLVVHDPEDVDAAFDLPEAQPEGCVLRLYDDYDSQEENIRTAVRCSDHKIVGIFAAMGDELVDIARMRVGPDEPAVAHLGPDDDQWPRPAGTVRISVVEDKEPPTDDAAAADADEAAADISLLAERIAFFGRRAQLDIDLDFDRDTYHPGETIEFDVETRTPDGQPLPADLVKAAVDDRVHARADHIEVPSLLGRLLLEADDLHFWGDLDDADQYFDLYDDTAKGLDLLVGTRGWRTSPELQHFHVDGGDARIPDVSIIETPRTSPPPVLRSRREPTVAPEPELEITLDHDSDPFDSFGSTSDTSGAGGLGLAGAGRGGAEGGEGLGRGNAGTSLANLDADHSGTSAGPSDTADDPSPELQAPRFMRDDDAVAFVSWEPELMTRSDGRLTYTLELPEAIGAYRVLFEGIADSGHVGKAEHVVSVEAPLSVAVRLPEIISGKDRINAPVTLRNSTEHPLEADVSFEVDGPAVVFEELAELEMEIPPRSTATRYIPLEIDDARGEIEFRTWVQGGGFSDGASRTVDIEPRGFQRTWTASGVLPGDDDHTAPLMGMTDAGAEATLSIYPGPAAEALQGVDEMVRRPTGCFEQTSSINHPNILVWHHLDKTDQLDGKLRAELREHIQAGYDRMRSYEVADGGFDWFGRGPAQMHLTAWGLLQFSMMDDIIDVDDQMVRRAVSALHNGWQNDESWRRLSDDRRRSAQLFSLYALARADELNRLSAHLDRASRFAETSESSYDFALAAATAAYAGLDDADRLVSRLVQRQNDDGSWDGGDQVSWSGATGRALDVETTALATLAILESDGPQGAASDAIAWLDEQKSDTAWWGSTQATVLALDARNAFDSADPGDEEGPVTVSIDGQELEGAHIAADDPEPVRLDGLGTEIADENSELSIASEVPLSYDLTVTWRSEDFVAQELSPLTFDVGLEGADDAQLGDDLTLSVELENRKERALGMTVARIPLPAGVEIAPRELDAMVDRTDVDYYETTGRDIVLYFDEFGAEEHQRVDMTATAAVPGSYEFPAPVAYPYYRDEDHWQWGEPTRFAIATPQ